MQDENTQALSHLDIDYCTAMLSELAYKHFIAPFTLSANGVCDKYKLHLI
jgi:hypothetical protein